LRTEILIYDGIDELDALGPYEVLAEGGFDVAWSRTPLRTASSPPAA
jgi:putative intracellular protease/amidase